MSTLRGWLETIGWRFTNIAYPIITLSCILTPPTTRLTRGDSVRSLRPFCIYLIQIIKMSLKPKTAQKIYSRYSEPVGKVTFPVAWAAMHPIRTWNAGKRILRNINHIADMQFHTKKLTTPALTNDTKRYTRFANEVYKDSDSRRDFRCW